MTYAYTEDYLDDAMENLGEAFDYAVNACHLDMNEFMRLFIVSGYADGFANGNPKIIAGLSGTELVMEIMEKTGKEMSFPEAQVEYDYSAEYWCGWVLAFYQWKTQRTFQEIMKYISMSEMLRLYPTLHEAPEEKFIDTMEHIIDRKTLQQENS
jgi:hypothetical protein